MYPALRLDHLRYLEKCGLIKPASRNNNESFFGFADLTALRQIAGELQQGAPFRAVVRNLQASRTGQLAFDFRLEAQPARIIELKPRTPVEPNPWHPWHPWNRLAPLAELSEAEQYFLMGSLLDDGTPERIEEAVKAYRRALDHDPDLVAALINLANIRYSRDELAEAQALYERAIALDSVVFRGAFQSRQHPSRSRPLRGCGSVVSPRAVAQQQLSGRSLLPGRDAREDGPLGGRPHALAHLRAAGAARRVGRARQGIFGLMRGAPAARTLRGGVERAVPLLLLLLTAAVYLWRLGEVPVYLAPDEAIIANDAYALATTGRALGRHVPAAVFPRRCLRQLVHADDLLRHRAGAAGVAVC